MKYLYRVQDKLGYQGVITEESGLKYLSIDVLKMSSGRKYEGDSEEEELVITSLQGECSVSLKEKKITWVVQRSSVFSDKPTSFYIPPKNSYVISSETDTELVIAKSPCNIESVNALEPALISLANIKVISSGAANWRRDVHMIMGARSLSQKLIIGETINPPGNWSSYPPHKHDQSTENESVLEEIYYFKTYPDDGYGIVHLYDGKDLNELLTVENNDILVIPKGYHPVVSTPGTVLYYFWALAGPEKVFKVSVEERFKWLDNARMILKEVSLK
ncbi:MAG: 5-deoxy-glucuronate isomerase [Candidatus Bathyarchaeota archaeon]|nr:5-deoxy-glucuronate isomerase [Candidatus Bathyarchaeota archaeon]